MVDPGIGRLECKLPRSLITGPIGNRDPDDELLDLLACPPDCLTYQVGGSLAGQDSVGSHALPAAILLAPVLHHERVEPE